MLFKKILIALSFLVLTGINASGQRFVTTQDFDKLSKVTFGFNINTYFGELRRVQDPKLQAGFGFGVGYDHLMTDNIALRTQLSLYSIKADDALSTIPDVRTRNLNFKATNVEFVVQGVYYTMRHPPQGYSRRAFVNPYFHLGIGITTNNPTAELLQNGATNTYDLRPLQLEGNQYGGLAFNDYVRLHQRQYLFTS